MQPTAAPCPGTATERKASNTTPSLRLARRRSNLRRAMFRDLYQRNRQKSSYRLLDKTMGIPRQGKASVARPAGEALVARAAAL